VSLRGGVSPAVGTNQRSVTCAFSSYDGSSTANTAQRPSGLTAGAPTRFINHKSSWVIARAATAEDDTNAPTAAASSRASNELDLRMPRLYRRSARSPPEMHLPAVALVAIVKDEARSLYRLLDSVRGLVDEMVVVDTGSHDDTVAIARAAGAKVSYFEWISDFAAARNFALSQTRAPWRLVLDADEWLDRDTSDLRAVCAEAPTFVGRIARSDRFDSDVAGRRETLVSRVWISRLLPIGVTYSGAIHEQVVHDLPTQLVPLHVFHDGYEDQQLARKGDRNLEILAQLADRGSSNAYLDYQYAKELERKGELAAAAERYARYAVARRPDLRCARSFRSCARLRCRVRIDRPRDRAVRELGRLLVLRGLFSNGCRTSQPANRRAILRSD
jgi:Glycosyl transferase family 2